VRISGLFPPAAEKDTSTIGGLCEAENHAVAPVLRRTAIMTRDTGPATRLDPEPVLAGSSGVTGTRLPCGVEVGANRNYDSRSFCRSGLVEGPLDSRNCHVRQLTRSVASGERE